MKTHQSPVSPHGAPEINPSLEVACGDQHCDLYRNYDYDEQVSVKTKYKEIFSDLDTLMKKVASNGGIPGVVFKNDRTKIIISLYINHDNSDKRELLHITLFQGDRYGGLHATHQKTGEHIYLTNEHILKCCGEGKQYYTTTNFFSTLAYYFETKKRITPGKKNEDLPQHILNFINTCITFDHWPMKSSDDEKPSELIKQQTIVRLLRELENASAAKSNKRFNPYKPSGGGSIKIELYSVKIEKLRELNKKLRKNKTKNKNKIENNNKQIDKLKINIKKEKEKTKLKKQKEELKKQKDKEKLKKQKVKKVHVTKKTKK
tara:strand:- start:3276 stop:4229 length:954 start_codon:yes stop_codon:yes gene_type:complete